MCGKTLSAIFLFFLFLETQLYLPSYPLWLTMASGPWLVLASSVWDSSACCCAFRRKWQRFELGHSTLQSLPSSRASSHWTRQPGFLARRARGVWRFSHLQHSKVVKMTGRSSGHQNALKIFCASCQSSHRLGALALASLHVCEQWTTNTCAWRKQNRNITWLLIWISLFGTPSTWDTDTVARSVGT